MLYALAFTISVIWPVLVYIPILYGSVRIALFLYRKKHGPLKGAISGKNRGAKLWRVFTYLFYVTLGISSLYVFFVWALLHGVSKSQSYDIEPEQFDYGNSVKSQDILDLNRNGSLGDQRSLIDL